MAPLHQRVLALCALLSTLFLAVSAETAQFCKCDSPETAGSQINFCAGMKLHENTTSGEHDLYLTFTTRRHRGSALGWTAIGPGRMMADSLMFIIYGDPTADSAPIVSIRTSPSGHHQPVLVTQNHTGPADLRVLRAAWMPATDVGFTPDNPTYDAVVNVVCYACARWPGLALDPHAASQPWLWAWNPSQEFDVFSYDAHLLMHAHHAGTGGWGNFYVDSAATIARGPMTSVPAIRPGGVAVLAAELPLGVPTTAAGLVAIATSPRLHVHGVAMGLAFVLLFPLGVVLLRRGGGRAFKLHWVVQLVASLLALLGLATGLLLRSKVDTVHQGVGITIVVALALQGVLGWRHHMVYLKIQRRTWISYAHIYIGRVAMLAAGGNLLAGMVLCGYSTPVVASMGVLVGLITLGLAFWLWRAQVKQQRQSAQGTPASEAKYFALSESDDEDQTSDEEKGMKRSSSSASSSSS